MKIAPSLKTRLNDQFDMSGGYTEERTKIILSWIGTNKKVLDIGCFDGRESLCIKNQKNDVYGTDVTKKALLKAKKQGIKTFLLDIEKDKWTFNKNFFDVVIAGEIIEHLIDPDDFLENIKGVLKPKGTLIITTPNLASLGRRILLFLGKNPFIEISKFEEVNGFPAVGHVRYFNKNSLNKILTYHGFIVEEITSDKIFLGVTSSVLLAKIFPTLGWRFIVRAVLP